MRVIETDDMRKSYTDIAQLVLSKGQRRAPRDQLTYDLGPTTIVLSDPRRAVPTDIGRKLNLRIGAAETVQLIAGVSDAAQLNGVSGDRFQRFTNNDLLTGAYGPRAFSQLPGVITKIAQDYDTRQGWVNIWRAGELEDDTRRDIPCTVALGFFVDAATGKLDMMTFMRSNDLWLGVPYDFMMFTRLQSVVAWALGRQVGTYTHTTVSLHLYARDEARLSTLHTPGAAITDIPMFAPCYDTRPNIRSARLSHIRWHRATAWAKACVIGSGAREKLPTYVRWYYDELTPARSGNVLCSICRYVKPRDQFYDCHIPLRQGRCKSCVSTRRRDPDKRFTQRLGRYGLTKDDFTDLLTAQNHVCAICGEIPSTGPTRDFVIDHDHHTGVIRGLLCNRCNNGLGLLGDDIDGLTRALNYLLRAQKTEGDE